MNDQNPIVAPPLQLNYQSAPTPDTPSNVTVLSLDSAGLPSYRLKYVIVRSVWAFAVVLVVLAAFWLIGVWKADLLFTLLSTTAWTAFAVGIAAISAWRDITRVWNSFRLMMDEVEITRIAKGRVTTTITYVGICHAQYSFMGGLVLRDKNNRLLVVPREISGWNVLKSRVQQYLQIKPARVTLKLILQLPLPLVGALFVVSPPVAIWFMTNQTAIHVLSIVGTIATILLASFLLRCKNLSMFRKLRVTLVCALVLAAHASRFLFPSIHF